MFGLVFVDPVPDLPDPPACDVSASCLDCPLPTCRYEDPAAYLRWRHATHGMLIREQGWSPSRAARELGVSERTVFRYLRQANEFNANRSAVTGQEE